MSKTSDFPTYKLFNVGNFTQTDGMNFVYLYELSDGSSGFWITTINPRLAGYELPSRFPGRKLTMIKWVNK